MENIQNNIRNQNQGLIHKKNSQNKYGYSRRCTVGISETSSINITSDDFNLIRPFNEAPWIMVTFAINNLNFIKL